MVYLAMIRLMLARLAKLEDFSNSLTDYKNSCKIAHNRKAIIKATKT